MHKLLAVKYRIYNNRRVRNFFPLIIIICFICFQACADKTREISIEVHEGTELTFDLSPDGKTIVFDLLGQIWLLPSDGGEAKAITNSVLENAEHLYPSFSSDGTRIVFWESRPSSWGLTSMDLNGGSRKILTELSSSQNDSYNDRFFSPSPTGNNIVFIRDGNLFLISEEAGDNPKELKLEKFPGPGITDPAWYPDGEKLAIINASANYTSHSGGQLWQIGVKEGISEPLSDEKNEIRSPAYSPDGSQLAYFVLNENLSYDIWIHNLQEGEPRRLAVHNHITPLRLRWTPDGKHLIYCAEGRLWRLSADGGQTGEIPFTASLNFSQDQLKLKKVRFAQPGEIQKAKGHFGMEISPDGKKIAVIALGQLWAWEIEKEPAPVAKLPVTAGGLCWSPDNSEVAWSGGVSGEEDLFATDIISGKTRQLTAIPGTEVRVSWSPDGNYIAFIHRKIYVPGAPPQRSYESMCTIKLSDVPVSDLAQTTELQKYPAYGQSLILGQGRHWGRPWSPDSRFILSESNGQPVLLSPGEEAHPLADSKPLPSIRTAPLWDNNGFLLYIENFMLWRTPFDIKTGIRSDSVPVSQDPALYPSVAQDGSVLYISEDGFRIRRPDDKLIRLGWPIS